MNRGFILIITVIGNDSRQRELARLLNRHYDTIYLSGSEEIKIVKSIIKISDAVILPLPVSRDNTNINTTDFLISEILENIPDSTTVFAGMCDKINTKHAMIDYNEFEDFTLKNAFYTAESAIALSIINMPFSLSDAKVLILGNGRIGKYLGDILSTMCKDITVSARKEKDFDYIKAKGFTAVNTNKIPDLSQFNLIFNTIPENVISKDVLSTCGKNTLIIDLASKKSGLYKDEGYIDAKALPAKYCKKSTAKALYDSVSKYLY